MLDTIQKRLVIIKDGKLSKLMVAILLILASMGLVAILKLAQQNEVVPANTIPLIALCIITGMSSGRIAGSLCGLIGFYISAGFGMTAFLYWVMPYVAIGFIAGCIRNQKHRNIFASILFIVGFIVWWIVSNLPVFILGEMNWWDEYNGLFSICFNAYALPFLMNAFMANLVCLTAFFGIKYATSRNKKEYKKTQ